VDDDLQHEKRLVHSMLDGCTGPNPSPGDGKCPPTDSRRSRHSGQLLPGARHGLSRIHRRQLEKAHRARGVVDADQSESVPEVEAVSDATISGAEKH
jgi:hypothetical protein